MHFHLKFNMDNAAFHDNEPDGQDFDPVEVARILREAADDVQEWGILSNTVRDANGNKVGKWGVRGGG